MFVRGVSWIVFTAELFGDRLTQGQLALMMHHLQNYLGTVFGA
jgi:hypothetical protein